MKLVSSQSNIPAPVSIQQIKKELIDAMCFGTQKQIYGQFKTVLEKYGMPTDKIDILMKTPVCKIAAAIEGITDRNNQPKLVVLLKNE